MSVRRRTIETVQAPVLTYFWYRASALSGSLTYNSTTQTITGLAGSNTATISTVGNVQKGSIIRIGNALTGEIFTVINRVDTSITLNGYLLADYTAASLFISGVGTFNDLSGNGFNLLQNTGASQPQLIKEFQGGRDFLFFDGSNDNLKTAAFALNQPYTLYAVTFGSNSSSQFVSDGLSANAWLRLNNGPNSINANSGVLLTNTNFTPGTIFRVITFVSNGAQSMLRTNSNPFVIGNVGTNNPGGLTMGSLRGGGAGNFFGGYIAEMRGYIGAHSETLANRIKTELNSYYAIAT